MPSAIREFDAVLFDTLSAPSLFRSFLVWHSGASNIFGFASGAVDSALDRIRHARLRMMSTTQASRRSSVQQLRICTAIFLASSGRRPGR